MLGVEKTFSLQGESGVGGMVDFNITLKNNGNVDLVDVALTDAMFQNDQGEICVATKGITFQDLNTSTEGFRFYVALMEITIRSISRGHVEISVKYVLYCCAALSFFNTCRCLSRLLYRLPGDTERVLLTHSIEKMANRICLFFWGYFILSQHRGPTGPVEGEVAISKPRIGPVFGANDRWLGSISCNTLHCKIINVCLLPSDEHPLPHLTMSFFWKNAALIGVSLLS